MEFVKTEAKVVYILECLQKTEPPVLIFAERKQVRKPGNREEGFMRNSDLLYIHSYDNFLHGGPCGR